MQKQSEAVFCKNPECKNRAKRFFAKISFQYEEQSDKR
ncbi:Uncharacterized protein dnm_049510 [Desulfonema magnum]|uniref:Uncharacterized protein n=1 Tax=Desulfonema magnum TaxID=45655 RepID=A0A975GPJ7_9BACT|nr:Uncharacterized protein dnm_049510 [Desulfonema magnum]